MASNILRMVFKGVADKKLVFNFAYAKSNPTEGEVRALGTAMITNKDIYEDQPQSLSAAEVIVTTNTPINIS